MKHIFQFILLFMLILWNFPLIVLFFISAIWYWKWKIFNEGIESLINGLIDNILFESF